MRVTNNAAKGTAYADIRVGEGHAIHQVKLDVSELTGVDDADGVLPPGLPIRVDGTPVSAGAQTAYGVIGPEPVKIGAADHFGNVILSGGLNRDMMEDNLARAISADELTALAEIPAIRLI